MDKNPAFSAYFKALSPAERAAFVERAGTSIAYCHRLIDTKERRIGPDLAARFAEASQGQLAVRDLCPDFPWHVAQAA